MLVEAELPLLADYSVAEVIVRVDVLSVPPNIQLFPEAPVIIVAIVNRKIERGESFTDVLPDLFECNHCFFGVSSRIPFAK